MADPLYTRLLATANRLINQYGKDAVVERDSESGPDYNPVVTTTEYDVKLVETGYSLTNLTGTLIQTGDKVGLIAMDGETEPRHGDRILIGGDLYAFVDLQPLNPGGVQLLTEFVARR